MSRQLAENAALVIVDFQKAIDDPKWGPRNNPEAEAQALRLLEAWRAAGRPVVHVQHLSREPGSPYRPGQPGCDFKPALAPQAGEILVQKQTHNAFLDTGLEAALRDRGVTAVVIAGVLLHNSVDASVRMAADLGFDTWLVADATFSVDVTALDGRRWPAADVHALSLQGPEHRCRAREAPHPRSRGVGRRSQALGGAGRPRPAQRGVCRGVHRRQPAAAGAAGHRGGPGGGREPCCPMSLSLNSAAVNAGRERRPGEREKS